MLISTTLSENKVLEIIPWNHLILDIDRGVSRVALSLRAQFAVENEPINQLHGSASDEEAEREISFFFPKQKTLAVIKPDAVERHTGASLLIANVLKKQLAGVERVIADAD